VYGSGDAVIQAPRGPRPGRRTLARRRHDRSGDCQGQNRYRSNMGLCASATQRRRRRCFITRAIEPASIPRRTDFAGIFQANAYSGYGRLYETGRSPGDILEAACWVHARRPFFVMADLAENARRKAQGKTPAVPSAASMRCSTSSGRSMVRVPIGAKLSARSSARHWSRICKHGCASSVPSSRAATMSPKPWTTCSSVGPRSPGSSTMGESAYQTTPPNELCAVLQFRGHSAGIGRDVVIHYRWYPLFGQSTRRIRVERRAAGELASLDQRSDHSPMLGTAARASMATPTVASTNSCPGPIQPQRRSKTWP
jgi:hypothetical protein